MKKKKLSLCVLTLVLSLIACVTVLEAPKVFADEGSWPWVFRKALGANIATSYNTLDGIRLRRAPQPYLSKKINIAL